jgi:hypothetical protein
VESRQVSVHIDRAASEVYDFVVDPANLPLWAAGLSGSIDYVGGQWVAASPMGSVVVEFVPRNDRGVLDHDVTLPSGEVVTNPMRVLADGAGSELVFTVNARPGMSPDDLERDAAAVRDDLAALKRRLERSPA